MEEGASQTILQFSLRNQNEGLDHSLQLRLFPFVFFMVVEGRVNGLVQTLGASLVVGTGEGPTLEIPGLPGN